MQPTSSKLLLLIDLRDIVLLQQTIDNLNKSIDLLQEKVETHPISKYRNYRPKNALEKIEYEYATNDLAKIVSPQHKIITLRNYILKQQNQLKESLQEKTGKSFEDHIKTLSQSELALVYSSEEEFKEKRFDVEFEEMQSNIKSFDYDEYEKEQARGKLS